MSFKTLETLLLAGGIAAFGSGCATSSHNIKPTQGLEYKTGVDYNLNGSAVVENDGSYWVRESEGWRAYNPDGTKQGSWLGDSGSDEPDPNIQRLINEEGAKYLRDGFNPVKVQK